jgi:branched-chain amino acid transport system ATP-binding protein
MLEIQSLHAGYGALPVLHDINLSIGRNEAVAIVGPNGAGKTTLVRTLCGLVSPMAGRIVKDGADLADLPAHRRPEHGIAVVLENRNLFVELSVGDNLRLAESAGRKAADDRARFSLDEVLKLFPIVKERYHSSVGLLSGGQQQMVAIGRGLASSPRLLMLDEPSMGLAPTIVDTIFERIVEIRRDRKLTILLVEQRAVEALQSCDRGYVLETGRVVLEGTHDALLSNDRVRKAYLGI